MKRNYEIIQGDCLEVMPTLPDDCAACTITSPPYNMRTRIRNGEYTTRENSEHFSKKYAHFGDDLSIDKYYEFHKAAIAEMLRLSPIVFWNIAIVTGSKEAVFQLIGDYRRELKDIIVWDKGWGQPAMHPAVINRGTELILIFERVATAGRAFSQSYFERGAMEDIWRIAGGKNQDEHGAIFPIDIPLKIISNWTRPGDTVLDPFMGTGTVGVACEKLDRKFIGIEISREYYEDAFANIEAESIKLKLFKEES
jgi:site-specific DNA-methyltransferase (adenine-specific)/modification methylase